MTKRAWTRPVIFPVESEHTSADKILIFVQGSRPVHILLSTTQQQHTMGTKLIISHSESSIDRGSSPQLMPFHIAYSGPSPISTFFRVKNQSDTSNPTTELVANVKAIDDSQKPSLKSRLVAAFRGRQVVGTQIELPKGYSGIILRNTNSNPNVSALEEKRALEEEREAKLKKARAMKSKSKSTAKPPSRRSTRRTRASSPEVEEREEDTKVMDVDALDEANDTPIDPPPLDSRLEETVKVFKPTQAFNSLILWNADIAVDEGRDEYVRALKEWTTISAEVCSHIFHQLLHF